MSKAIIMLKAEWETIMEKVTKLVKGRRWIEYIGLVAVCAGLWMGWFAGKVTFAMRIGQMFLMLFGAAACCIYEYAERKQDNTKNGIEKRRYTYAKSYEITYFGMLGIYSIIIIYAAAFEKNSLMLFMLALIFINIILNSTVSKKYEKEYEKHGDNMLDEVVSSGKGSLNKRR